MLYFFTEFIIYIAFMAASKAEAGEKITGKKMAVASLIAFVSLVLSLLVELPLRINWINMLEQRRLYICVVLIIDLVKIVIPYCAILTMSNVFGNTHFNSIILILSLVMVIISLAMVTYEQLAFFKMYDDFTGGQLDFFSVLTGGPMSYGFGKIHLVVEFAPTVMQAVLSVVAGMGRDGSTLMQEP